MARDVIVDLCRESFHFENWNENTSRLNMNRFVLKPNTENTFVKHD